jgi:peptidoglycan/LPS O-acetylase OafA/YrhL
MNTFCRLDSIAAGLVLASLGTTWRVYKPAARVCFASLGLLLLLSTVYLVVKVPEVWLFSQIFAYSTIAIACAALVIAILGAGGIARNPILIYLGRISYGLYVFHEPALILAHRFSVALTIPLGAAITLALGAISYRWFETPFLRVKRRFEHVPSRPL